MKKLLALTIIMALALAACATNEQFKQARIEVAAGNEEAGLARLEQEIKAHPDDVELRNYYNRHKAVAVERYLALGDNARMAGASDRAQASYERALRFDAQNQHAQVGIAIVRKDRESRTMLVDAEQALKAGQTADAQAKLKQIVADNPQNKEAKGLLRQPVKPLHAPPLHPHRGSFHPSRQKIYRRADANHHGDTELKVVPRNPFFGFRAAERHEKQIRSERAHTANNVGMIHFRQWLERIFKQRRGRGRWKCVADGGRD